MRRRGLLWRQRGCCSLVGRGPWRCCLLGYRHQRGRCTRDIGTGLWRDARAGTGLRSVLRALARRKVCRRRARCRPCATGLIGRGSQRAIRRRQARGAEAFVLPLALVGEDVGGSASVGVRPFRHFARSVPVQHTSIERFARVRSRGARRRGRRTTSSAPGGRVPLGSSRRGEGGPSRSFWLSSCGPIYSAPLESQAGPRSDVQFLPSHAARLLPTPRASVRDHDQPATKSPCKAR